MSVSYTTFIRRGGASVTVATVSGSSATGNVVNQAVTTSKPGGGTLTMADLENPTRLQVGVTSSSYTGGETQRIRAIGVNVLYLEEALPPWDRR